MGEEGRGGEVGRGKAQPEVSGFHAARGYGKSGCTIARAM